MTMHDENEDPVWRLIGRVERPVAPAFFVPKTVRAALSTRRRGSLFPAWLPAWKLGGLAATSAAITLLLWQLSPTAERGNDASAPESFSDTHMARLTEDFELIANLDNLLADQEQQIWDESTVL